ncbi:unnamed protein product, partial [Amoebophrya sp. A25]|eukprot:GSA25T00023320001.1
MLSSTPSSPPQSDCSRGKPPRVRVDVYMLSGECKSFEVEGKVSTKAGSSWFFVTSLDDLKGRIEEATWVHREQQLILDDSGEPVDCDESVRRLFNEETTTDAPPSSSVLSLPSSDTGSSSSYWPPEIRKGVELTLCVTTRNSKEGEGRTKRGRRRLSGRRFRLCEMLLENQDFFNTKIMDEVKAPTVRLKLYVEEFFDEIYHTAEICCGDE